MTTISGSLGDEGVSRVLLVRPDEQLTVNLSVADGDSVGFIGTAEVQVTGDGEQWKVLNSYVGTIGTPLQAGGGSIAALTLRNREANDRHYRVQVPLFDDGNSSDNLVFALADVDDIIRDAVFKDGRIYDRDGTVLMTVQEGGIEFAKAIRQTFGVGSSPIATVVAAEYGDGYIHRTILTLASAPLPIV